MRFKDFLTEDEAFDLEKFKKDCAYFFEQTDGKAVMWHGTKNAPSDWKINRFTHRQGPRDSSRFLHDSLNKFFEEKFNYPFRNGLFVSGVKTVASVYGTRCAIFPIGKFYWLSTANKSYADMTNVFTRFREKAKQSANEFDYDEIQEVAWELMKDKLQKLEWVYNENLLYAIDSGAEVMLVCDKFYTFNFVGDTYQEIVEPYLKTQINKPSKT